MRYLASSRGWTVPEMQTHKFGSFNMRTNARSEKHDEAYEVESVCGKRSLPRQNA